MKAASKMDAVKKTLLEQKAGAVMVENCGLENETIYRGTEQIPDQAGYYSIIVVKNNKNGKNRVVFVKMSAMVNSGRSNVRRCLTQGGV